MIKNILVLVLLSSAIMPQFAQAEEAKPVQLAAFSPIQLVPEKDSIQGVRLGLFYTVNKDVTGLSLAWLGVNRATGDVKGVEIGLGNWVEGAAYGAQIGVVNHTGKRFVGAQYGFANVVEGDFTGVQWGLVNWTEGYMHGMQYGAVNVSKGRSEGIDVGIVNYNEGSFKGLQLGIFNYTRSLDGLQIGLANYNGNKKPFEFLPIVNWSF